MKGVVLNGERMAQNGNSDNLKTLPFVVIHVFVCKFHLGCCPTSFFQLSCRFYLANQAL